MTSARRGRASRDVARSARALALLALVATAAPAATRLSVEGPLRPDAEVRVRVHLDPALAGRRDLHLLWTWPPGLDGPELSPVEAVQAQVVGPVIPSRPVFVTVMGGEGSVDAARLALLVSPLEGGIGEEQHFLRLWLPGAKGGDPLPLPWVAAGDPEGLLAALPEAPRARAEVLLRAGVSALRQGDRPTARAALARAWRLRKLVRDPWMSTAIGVTAAVTLAGMGRSGEAVELCGRLERELAGDPLRRYPRYVRARVLAARGRRRAAARLAREVADDAPGFFAAADLAGRLTGR